MVGCKPTARIATRFGSQVQKFKPAETASVLGAPLRNEPMPLGQGTPYLLASLSSSRHWSWQQKGEPNLNVKFKNTPKSTASQTVTITSEMNKEKTAQ